MSITSGGGEPAKILFVSKQAGSDYFNICTMNPDGSEQVCLTESNAVEVDPTWSPDRKRIAFAVLNPEQDSSDIYVMNHDGSQRKQLTKHPAGTIAFAPCWSPDGKQIAFSMVKGQSLGLFVMNSDGENPRRLGEGPGMIPAWSPDGKKILYTSPEGGGLSKTSLHVMDSDGKNTRLLANGKAGMGAWSPDGERIVYMGYDDDAGWGIFVMNADGSGSKRLRAVGNGNDAEIGPQWSADGKEILFTGSRLTSPPTSVIFVMDAGGGNVRQLTDSDTISFLGNGASFFVIIAESRVESPPVRQ